MPKYVYDFTEGNKDLKDLLGGKGANLAEMTNLGLPVPPGFTITTEACQAYLEHRRRARRARATRSASTSTRSRRRWARQLGQPDDPLLVSVRSGAKFSMPGMMETVLNIGLNDESVQGLAKQAGNERFAWDSYRRLIQMFGKTVLGIDGEHFEDALDEAKKAKGTDERPRPRRRRPAARSSRRSRRSSSSRPAATFPQEPREQMDLADPRRLRLVERRPRAILYRRQERIPADLGTAVNVCSMVFGNLGMDSGTGVAFTRDPAQRRAGRLRRLPAERAGRGRRRRHPQHRAAGRPRAASTRRPTTSCMAIMADAGGRTTATCATSSSPSSAASCGCCRPGSASAPRGAAFRIATQLVDEGLIDMDEALQRVTGAQLAQLMFPRFDDERRRASRSPRA